MKNFLIALLLLLIVIPSSLSIAQIGPQEIPSDFIYDTTTDKSLTEVLLFLNQNTTTNIRSVSVSSETNFISVSRVNDEIVIEYCVTNGVVGEIPTNIITNVVVNAIQSNTNFISAEIVNNQLVISQTVTNIGSGTGSGLPYPLFIDGIQDGEVLVFDANLNIFTNAPQQTAGAALDITTTTDEDITVLGVNVGNYSDGFTISSGTTLQTILKNLLQVAIPATYINPAFSISTSPTHGSTEVGTSVTPIITPSFTQNDAGGVTSYILTRGGSPIFQSSTLNSYTDSSFIIEDVSYTYQGTVFYDAGPIKNDNLGNPSPDGSIQSGSLASSRAYTGARRYWLGLSTESSDLVQTSADVKLLSQNGFHTSAQNISITAPVGTKRVVVAYRASRGNLVSAVVDKPFPNFSVLSVFNANRITVNVGGVNNYSPVSYYVYHYIPDTPTTESLRFDIRIP